ncbi:MAG: hypothetical protein ACRDZW_06275, partial [Acidimicrobiales bacterium]
MQDGPAGPRQGGQYLGREPLPGRALRPVPHRPGLGGRHRTEQVGEGVAVASGRSPSDQGVVTGGGGPPRCRVRRLGEHPVRAVAAHHGPA